VRVDRVGDRTFGTSAIDENARIFARVFEDFPL